MKQCRFDVTASERQTNEHSLNPLIDLHRMITMFDCENAQASAQLLFAGLRPRTRRSKSRCIGKTLRSKLEMYHVCR